MSWVDHFKYLCSSSNTFSGTFSIEEIIMEIMMLDEPPRDNNHHRYSLLKTLENNLGDFSSPNITETFKDSISIHDVNSKKNLENNEETIHLDISIKPRVIEKIHIGVSFSPEEINNCKAIFQEFFDIFTWIYKEIPSVDMNIIVHEIKTYLDAKPI